MLTTLYTFIQIRIILYTHYKYIQCFKHFLFYNYIDSTKAINKLIYKIMNWWELMGL